MTKLLCLDLLLPTLNIYPGNTLYCFCILVRNCPNIHAISLFIVRRCSFVIKVNNSLIFFNRLIKRFREIRNIRRRIRNTGSRSLGGCRFVFCLLQFLDKQFLDPRHLAVLGKGGRIVLFGKRFRARPLVLHPTNRGEKTPTERVVGRGDLLQERHIGEVFADHVRGRFRIEFGVGDFRDRSVTGAQFVVILFVFRLRLVEHFRPDDLPYLLGEVFSELRFALFDDLVEGVLDYATEKPRQNAGAFLGGLITCTCAFSRLRISFSA